MLIVQKPLKTVETHRHVCDFHKRNPGKSFCGCTCSGGYSAREKTLEEMTDEEREWYFNALRGEN